MLWHGYLNLGNEHHVAPRRLFFLYRRSVPNPDDRIVRNEKQSLKITEKLEPEGGSGSRPAARDKAVW